MYSVLRTDTFDKWLTRFRDGRAKARIAARIRSAELGNLGDVKRVGGGVSEMRVHFGPGYRIYFTIRKTQLIILVVGGDKSTQARDIERAKAIAAELDNDKT